MNDGAALLRAICANPDDDTARLVYADWLDENDQPERAEFIRVQIEVSRCDAPNGYCNCGHVKCRWCPLYWRQSALTIVGGPLFGKLLPAGLSYACFSGEYSREIFGNGVGFLRGFGWRWRCPLVDYDRDAARLFAVEPITEVVLVDRNPWAGNWVKRAGRGEPDVFGWWADDRESLQIVQRSYVLPLALLDHMASDPRRLPTPLDYRPGNGGHGGVFFAHDSTARDAAGTAAAAHGRELAGLPPLSARSTSRLATASAWRS